MILILLGMKLDHETAVRQVSELSSIIAAGAGILIDGAIAQGKRLPITKLSEDLANRLGSDKAFCYHVISKYIVARGDLYIKMGPNGGIDLKPAAGIEREFNEEFVNA